MQLAASVQLPPQLGGCGGEAVFLGALRPRVPAAPIEATLPWPVHSEEPIYRYFWLLPQIFGLLGRPLPPPLRVTLPLRLCPSDTEGSFMEERAVGIIDASIQHVQRSAARAGASQIEAVRPMA